MAKVSMTVNGKPASGDVEGRTLLASFLRDELGLTGTHVGCDTSQCGACVVHVNGKAVKSCTMLAAEADGAEVATIEGQAAPDGTLNAIQQAFHNQQHMLLLTLVLMIYSFVLQPRRQKVLGHWNVKKLQHEYHQNQENELKFH